jgi:hypothetical protein
MATNIARTIDSDSGETASVKNETAPEVEYPVQLAYTPAPALCLAGTVSMITPGRRDLALSDSEWQDLELLELMEEPEAPESQEAPISEDVADGE